jgi:hypothetical protein
MNKINLSIFVFVCLFLGACEQQHVNAKGTTTSPLKPHNQINGKFVGNLYGRSSIKIAYFVPTH